MSHPSNVIDIPGALILGAGVAGLFAALKLAPYPATVLAATPPGSSGSSAWAQGGIAAAVAPGDCWQSHVADTLSAGAGTCERAIVEIVAREAAARIEDLVRIGIPFDRMADGSLAVGREAAHSVARIVHIAGDCAGAEITRMLALKAWTMPSIRLVEGYHALELAQEDGRVVGVFARSGQGQQAQLTLFRAEAVILATGGLGSLYAVTTNPPEVRGEGLGMAARAGAIIADAEFVQFHPTAIAIGRDPAPLATEALRGKGATLVDSQGRRIMDGVHPDLELAPRDVVARALYREIASGHRVFLDCRTAVGAAFAKAFPTVYGACIQAGIDPAVTPIPVAPAAHYHMGGIATDAHGRSSLEGLWAVGECASTGLHGANRLASNSLLEALVFGARTAEDVRGRLASARRQGALPGPQPCASALPPAALRAVMTRHLGLERNGSGLRAALAAISTIERASANAPALANMLATARLVAAAAWVRRESRGGHYRSDYPQTEKTGMRSFLTLTEAQSIADAAQPGNLAAVAC